MFKALFGNLGTKLAALVIALLLWGVAHSSDPTERGFDIPIALGGVPDDLVVTDQSTSEVNVRVKGTRAGLRNLSAANLEYRVDASGAKPGVMTLELELGGVELPRGAVAVARSPSTLQLTLARRGVKAVRVRPDLSGEPAEGYQVAGIEVEPDRVRVTGARAEVLRLNEVLTETVDIKDAQADVVRDVRLSLGGNTWLEEPTTVEIRVRIEPTASTDPTSAEEEIG